LAQLVRYLLATDGDYVLDAAAAARYAHVDNTHIPGVRLFAHCTWARVLFAPVTHHKLLLPTAEPNAERTPLTFQQLTRQLFSNRKKTPFSFVISSRLQNYRLVRSRELQFSRTYVAVDAALNILECSCNVISKAL